MPPTLSPWSATKAHEWYSSKPWPIGCNFLPSTAVNDIEMWQRETFDLPTIDRELALAQDIGFNSVRVFVNFVIWESDPAWLMHALDQFLSVADRHGIATMVILLDDCFKQDPKPGPQAPPVPGMHNSQWEASPGRVMTGDPSTWNRLQKYVTDVVSSFAHDPRVLVWDIYNEPCQSLELVRCSFEWARNAQPDQPLTTCVYSGWDSQIAGISDVISFHNYGDLPDLTKQIDTLRVYDRPLLCTEWMARTQQSVFETHLPYLKMQRVAAWSWGLVNGRTQTHIPWGNTPKLDEPDPWFHDIFCSDGSPKYAHEIDIIRATTGKPLG